MKITKKAIAVSLIVALCLIMASVIMGINGDDGQEDLSADGAVSEVAAVGEIHDVVSNASWAIDISDPAVVAERSSNIALVKIESIDGSDNYSEISNEYVYPYSYGRMIVLENLKGELSVDDDITFYKVGGILTAEQHYNGLTEAKKEYYKGPVDGPDLFKYSFSGDVELEEGKVYLAYLKPDSVYRGKPDTYGFICAQGGLREVQIQSDGKLRSRSEIKVLNNFTGDWENLVDVVDDIN